MCNLIPGILESDFVSIEEKLAKIKTFAKSVHIDFLDGKFSSESSFMDPLPFKKYANDFYLEAHLMVDDPGQYLESLYNAGFKRFIGHIEKMSDVEEFVARGQLLGEVVLALDLDTNLTEIKISLDDLDGFLLMSVKAGKSGQMFQEQIIEKIKSLRNLTNKPIEIDGGINENSILRAKDAGANRFVATSYIFGDKDPQNAFTKICGLISS